MSGGSRGPDLPGAVRGRRQVPGGPLGPLVRPLPLLFAQRQRADWGLWERAVRDVVWGRRCRATARDRVPRAQPAPVPGLRGTPGPLGPPFSPSSRGAGALVGNCASALLGGFCGAAVVWQWPETGSPGRGPRLGLPDAARSRGLQVPQEGSSSPFFVRCRLRERAVEGAQRGAGVGAIAGRRGRAPANSGGTGGPDGRDFGEN